MTTSQNLAAAAARKRVPLLLINARLSARSARGYARIGPLVRPLLRSLAGVAAQTDDDAARLRALGALDVAVTGNLKFDVDVAPAMRERGRVLRERFGIDRPVVEFIRRLLSRGSAARAGAGGGLGKRAAG